MKHVAAYLLAVLGGNASPSAADVTAIMESVGAKADAARLEQLCAELKGKNVFEIIEAGKKKMGSVAFAAAAPAAAAPAAGAAAAKDDAAAKKAEEERKKKEEEEKKKAEEEEEDADLGLDLFA